MSTDARIEVENDDLVTVRDAMRGLNGLVDDLTEGSRQQVVLMRHGKMQAVVVSFARMSAMRLELRMWQRRVNDLEEEREREPLSPRA